MKKTLARAAFVGTLAFGAGCGLFAALWTATGAAWAKTCAITCGMFLYHLAIRVIGDLTKEKLDTLRDADAIYREEIAAAGEDKNINQYFAVLTNTRSVGVMGDGRTYDYTLALRAVTTSDFMTADWARIPYDVLDRISTRIVNEVKGINRIVYDVTSKPPATIEWE